MIKEFKDISYLVVSCRDVDMLTTLLFSVLLVGVHSQTTSVSQCISNEGNIPVNTYIEGCETPPCLLPQLQDVVMHIVFRAPRTMRSMRTLATAYLSGNIITLPIPYDLGENSVTCNFLSNSYCPVMEGEVLQYTLKMYVEAFFPEGTSVPIEFRVVGETDNDPVFCIRVPIVIAPPVNGN